MRNDPAQFLSSLGELYSIWPSFFYAIGVVIVAAISGAFWLGYALASSGKEGLIQQKLAAEATIDLYKRKLDVGSPSEASAKIESLSREVEKSQTLSQVENVVVAAGLTPQTTNPALLTANVKSPNERLRIVLEYSFFYRAIESAGWTKHRQVQLADLRDVITGQQITVPVVSCKLNGDDVWWGGENDSAGNLIQKCIKYRAKLRFIGSNNEEQIHPFFLLRTSIDERPYIVEVFEGRDLDMKS